MKISNLGIVVPIAAATGIGLLRAQQRRNPRSAEQPAAEVAVWNHPIRVTTVHLAGSSVSTTPPPGRSSRMNAAQPTSDGRVF
jgi:hypothetical protein